jgi:cytosol alanyl aminopeptidase
VPREIARLTRRADESADVYHSLQRQSPHLQVLTMTALFNPNALRWCLAFVASTSMSLPAANDEFRMEKLARPIEQSIWLKLDPAQDSFEGRVTIELELLKAGKQIQFSGRDYTIGSATVTGAADCALTTAIGVQGVVTGTCAEELPAGRYTLSIAYQAPYNRQSAGLYKTIAGGDPYLFTQFEMSDARRAFPVFDEPEYKIPFTVTISVPDGLKVYANTPETAQNSKEGWTTREFAPTPPIPSYLLALAVGPLEEIPVTGLSVPGRIITVRGKSGQAAYAAEQMPRILAALETWFGRPYPYAKLDSVAVPEFSFGAMENVGLITYREELLLLDAEHASLEQKRSSLTVIAHEIAHQWYGNLVTMRWWDDLWLNEAFATWMGEKIIADLHPELDLHLVLQQNNAMPIDALVTTRPIRKPIRSEADIFDGFGLAYSKGGAVLGMVEQWIGADNFRDGVRAYLKAHEFGTAEASDLWSALGKAADKDVAAVLQGFLKQSSFPLLDVELAGTSLTISQRRFLYPGAQAAEQVWTVPVNVSYGEGQRRRDITVVLDKPSATIELEFEPAWIYPDTDGKGYYRFALSDDLLAQSLPHFNAQTLSVRERLAFIAGSNALFLADTLETSAYLRIIASFLDDPHPRPVSVALWYLDEMRKPLVGKSVESDWARYLKATTQPAVRRHGLVSRPDDAAGVNLLRSRLIRLGGLQGGDEEPITESRRLAELFLTDPGQSDSGLIGAHLAVAAFHGDEALHAKMVALFESTTKPDVRSHLLQALAMSGAPMQQSAVLDYLLTDHITASDAADVMEGLLYTEERAVRTRTWVYENYDVLTSKMPPFIVPLMPQLLGDGCEIAVLKSAQDFFQPRLAATPAYARTLEKTAESVQQCADLRARESEAFAAFIKRADL